MNTKQHKKMAKKRAVDTKSSQPKSFAGLIRSHSRSVQRIAKALRDLVYEELPDVQERFYGGKHVIRVNS